MLFVVVWTSFLNNLPHLEKIKLEMKFDTKCSSCWYLCRERLQNYFIHLC